MTEHVSSGCDQGIPRPADTPQEGVRSVLVRTGRTERLMALYVARNGIAAAFERRMNLNDGELRELARMAQRIADMAMGAMGD